MEHERPSGEIDSSPPSSPPGATGSAGEPRVVRISASSAIIGVAILALAMLGQRVFVAAHRPLSWALAAVVVAVLIDPLVDVLGRHIPRVVAVLGALLVVGGAAFGVVYRAFDELATGVDRLGDAAKDAAAQVERRDDGVGQLAQDVDASRRVDDFVRTVEDRVTGGDDVLASTGGTAPTYFLGAILTVFLMSYGPRLARSGLQQVPDQRRRDRIAHVALRAMVRGRRAVLFTLAEGLVAGLGVGLTAGALGLPVPSALGLAAGIVALLPHVGLVLGALPFLLLMLGLRSDVATIVVALIMVGVQLVDSLVVRPWIAARSVHVGLLVPWIVALVGYAVYGVGGAAYSLALAAFGLAAIDEIAALDRPEPAAAEDGREDVTGDAPVAAPAGQASPG